MNYTAQDLEQAVAAARIEAEEKAQGVVAAERERIASILKLPAAAGKEKQALAIALAGVPLDAATFILQAAQPDTPLHHTLGRSKDAPGGMVTVDPACTAPDQSPASDATAAWDRSISRVNKIVDDRKVRTNG